MCGHAPIICFLACYFGQHQKTRLPFERGRPSSPEVPAAEGLHQLQLAQAIQLRGWDTSRDSVTRLENQVQRVTDFELFIVAKCLDVRTDDLYAGDLERRTKVLAPPFRRRRNKAGAPPARLLTP
jgi:transcriptional regulator with XRE-family HTH domain